MSGGTVVWITGLPGSGKTTVAAEVERVLRRRSAATVRLDGDVFREVMGNDLGYSREDRLRNAWRVARICKLLSDQGLDVVCATVSLFREIHEWNRANFARYVEAYLRVSRDTLIARNQKGLMEKALAGDLTEVVGVDQAFDEPTSPDLVIANDGAESPASAAARIIALVRS
jgi:cytidine diphosphoramidate kinase